MFRQRLKGRVSRAWPAAMPLVVLLTLAFGVPMLVRLFVPAAGGGHAPLMFGSARKQAQPALRTPVSTAYQEEAVIRRVLYGEGAAYD